MENVSTVENLDEALTQLHVSLDPPAKKAAPKKGGRPKKSKPVTSVRFESKGFSDGASCTLISHSFFCGFFAFGNFSILMMERGCVAKLRTEIFRRLTLGHSGVRITRELKCSTKTIAKVKVSMASLGTLETKTWGGRKSKLTSPLKTFLKKFCSSHREATLEELRAILLAKKQIKVAPSTITVWIKQIGGVQRAGQTRCQLTARNKQQRFDYCKAQLSMSFFLKTSRYKARDQVTVTNFFIFFRKYFSRCYVC